MVSQKTIHELDFSTMSEYFEYIVDSIANGQRKQAKDLINDLSKAQKKQALNYLEGYTEATNLIIESL